MSIRRPSITLNKLGSDENSYLPSYHPIETIAVVTSGEICPGVSSAISYLIQYYHDFDETIDIILYKNGYKGLLKEDFLVVDEHIRDHAYTLEKLGGSPCGSSLVRLSETEDCLKAGLIEAGETAVRVACDNLKKDNIQVLHVIGGGDGMDVVLDLQDKLLKDGYPLQVIAFPTAISNDVYPISQSIGAWTAAEQGAKFFRNIVFEHSSNPRMLVIHEIKGRSSGWLAAATAVKYQNYVDTLPTCIMTRDQLSIHGLYVPEVAIDISREAERLKVLMDKNNCCNLFISEGAGLRDIIQFKEDNGEDVQRDCFGHPNLDSIDPCRWFGEVFAKLIGASKVMIQNSSYYARTAAANQDDCRLIRSSVELALKTAVEGGSGMIGLDEQNRGLLGNIELTRVGSGKRMNTNEKFFTCLMEDIIQVKRRSMMSWSRSRTLSTDKSLSTDVSISDVVASDNPAYPITTHSASID